MIAATLGISIADLPSCERARCGHCDVEFIARMCEKICNACPRTVVDVRTVSSSTFDIESTKPAEFNKAYRNFREIK